MRNSRTEFDHVTDTRVRAALLGRINIHHIVIALDISRDYLVEFVAEAPENGLDLELLSHRAQQLCEAQAHIVKGTDDDWRKARTCLRRYWSI